MTWPEPILAAFTAALDVEPAAGYTREQVLQALLDETVRRAVWRAQGDPERASAALRSPYTPLGSVVSDGIDGRAVRLTLHGSDWGRAVAVFHRFVEENAAALFDEFRDEGEPYDDRV
jgi:hypothetical protein